MLTRRQVLSSGATVALVALVSACKDKGATSRGDAPSTSSLPTASQAGPLDPHEPVDPAFQGCAKSCGSRSAKDRAEARAQPGPGPGEATFCPVSGAVFRITSQTPKREARGKTLFFCCDSCAAFFSSHEADVLAKRGLA